MIVQHLRELLSSSQIQERVIESISVEAEDLAGQRERFLRWNANSITPAEPVILDEAHDRSLVGNRVIYGFRLSPRYTRATAASDRTCNVQERVCSRGLGRAVKCLRFLADFSVIECPWPRWRVARRGARTAEDHGWEELFRTVADTGEWTVA